MFTKPLTLFLFSTFAVAVAQYYGGTPVAASGTSSSSSSATSTAGALPVAPTAPANTPGQINIDVAFQKNLVFNPPNISAPVGTLVTFYFPNFGTNHSVTQSTFANPCTYLAADTTTNTPGGFDSGLQSAATFTINVTDTNPIWYFCKQVGHCGLGMVGSINAPLTGTNTYAAYLAAASAIGSNEVAITDNGPVVAGVDATATGPPVPDLAAATGSASSGASGSSISGSNTLSSTPSSPTSPATTVTNGAMKATTSIGFALFAVVLAIAVA